MAPPLNKRNTFSPTSMRGRCVVGPVLLMMSVQSMNQGMLLCANAFKIEKIGTELATLADHLPVLPPQVQLSRQSLADAADGESEQRCMLESHSVLFLHHQHPLAGNSASSSLGQTNLPEFLEDSIQAA